MKKLYFKWMVDKVCEHNRNRRKYSLLLQHLDQVSFTYTHPMDENRESDGIELRYRFGYETQQDQHEVAYYIDDGPCSVLEMMVAMAIRIDDMIYDEDPGQWFWDMIEAMGLKSYTDENYISNQVSKRIRKMLNREIDPENGYGGLFILQDNRGEDLRDVEWWCQAMWHATEVTKG